MMLERKGIAYKRVDLMPVISKGALRAVGFPGITVPALKIDGPQGPGLARDRPRARPDPARPAAAAPPTPSARAAVEQAEAWGDEALQPVARRILWNALRRDRSPLASYSEGARLGVPIGLAVKTGQPLVALSARLNEATDENVRADLAALPGMLQRIDDWIAEGVLGGEELNAADLPDRDQRPPADDPPGPARADRRPPGRRAGDARRAGVPGRRAADPAAGLARAAARQPRPPRRVHQPRPRWSCSALSAPARPSPRVPVAQRRQRLAQAGAVGQRELGVELQQRHQHEPPRRSPRGCGSVSRSVSSSTSSSSSRSTSSGRGAVARAGRRSAPRSTSIALHEVEQLLRAELGLDPRPRR